MKVILTIFIIGFTFVLTAQIDTSYVHVRKKAAIMSLVLPGAGQFYNELGHRKVQGRKNISWWRAPIFIGGLVATAYLGYINADSANIYRSEWNYRNEFDFAEEVTLYPKFSNLVQSDLERSFRSKAQYRDYAIAGFALVYALNVVDAFVDAHFVSFDVSDDLSLNFKPRYFGPSEFGATLSLSFK